tara:strand:+ start:311 stop:679 length:369 start_codon:yes stop_codon:yes gene_type:complete
MINLTPQKWSFNDLSVFRNNKNQSIHIWEYYKWITIKAKPQDIVVLNKLEEDCYSCLLHDYELIEAHDGTNEFMSDSPIILKRIKSLYNSDVDLFIDDNTSFKCVSSHRTISLSKKDLNLLK